MQSPQYMIFTVAGIVGTAAGLMHNDINEIGLGLSLAIAGGYCWRNEANKQPPNPKP